MYWSLLLMGVHSSNAREASLSMMSANPCISPFTSIKFGEFPYFHFCSKGWGLLSPRPTPNMDVQGVVLSDPSLTNQSSMVGPARGTSFPSAQLWGWKGYTSLSAMTRHNTSSMGQLILIIYLFWCSIVLFRWGSVAVCCENWSGCTCR